MDRIESKSVMFFLPACADEFVGSESVESLEAFCEVVASDEVAEVSAQLVMAFIVIALDGGLFDGAVHPLDLSVGPGGIRFGKTVVDAVQKTDPVKRVTTEAGCRSLSSLRQIGA